MLERYRHLLRFLPSLFALGILLPSTCHAIKMHAGILLSESNFDDEIQQGMWFVETFSPFCAHCKRFAPAWIKLNDLVKPFESRGLRMGQIDCIAQGDLCVKLQVEYYPQMLLYEDGVLSETYTGDRSVEGLGNYLDTKSQDYAARHPRATKAVPVPALLPPGESASEETRLPNVTETAARISADGLLRPEAGVEMTRSGGGKSVKDVKVLPVANPAIVPPKPPPNHNGKVLTLNEHSFADYAASNSSRGPVFVKFFAPWCGHCRQLAPTWENLAKSLTDLVHVAELDCDHPSNKPICKKEGVKAYPTLIFYQDGAKVSYDGLRSLAPMDGFARKAASSAGAKDITDQEFDQLVVREDVFFLFVYSSQTPKEEIRSIQNAAKSFLGTALIYMSNSTALNHRFAVPHLSSRLMVFKDFQSDPWATMETHLSAHTGLSDASALIKDLTGQTQQFIELNGLALLSQLNALNYGRIFQSPNHVGTQPVNKLVVMACVGGLEDGDSKNLEAIRAQVKIWAGQWRKSQQARPTTLFVDWTWLNADQWHDWLSTNYEVGIPRLSARSDDKKDFKEFSSIIIVNPSQRIYYDQQANGDKILWEPSSVFQTLLGVEKGIVPYKIIGPLPVRILWRLRQSTKQTTIMIKNHFLAFMVLVGMVALVSMKILRTRRTNWRYSLLGHTWRDHESNQEYKHPSFRSFSPLPGGNSGNNALPRPQMIPGFWSAIFGSNNSSKSD